MDPVLDPLRDVAELMEECARGLRKNSDVTVEQIIGCIPVGVHIEIRMAVVVRNDLFTLKANSDGLVYDAGDCSQLSNVDDLYRACRVIRCDSWRTFFAYCASDISLSTISPKCRARAKMLPNSIADMVYEFQGRNESLTLFRLGEGHAPTNLLEGMLEFLMEPYFFHLAAFLGENLSSLCERIVNPVLMALGDALDEFKSAVFNKKLLLLVDWEARKLRMDFFPGESWVESTQLWTRVGAVG